MLTNVTEQTNLDTFVTGSERWSTVQSENYNFRIEQLGYAYLQLWFMVLHMVDNLPIRAKQGRGRVTKHDFNLEAWADNFHLHYDEHSLL